MSVEFVASDTVRDLLSRIDTARQRGLDVPVTAEPESAEYWQQVFENNAAAVLSECPEVHLLPDRVVRYRYFGHAQRDILLRPFVARMGTDVTPILHMLEWHAPPDSASVREQAMPKRDVELLYGHFQFERAPEAILTYWIAMQELWASARWIHSRIVCDEASFAQIVREDNWQVRHTPDNFQPAVLQDPNGSAELVSLVFSPIGGQTIALQRVQIHADNAIVYLDPIIVAQGPRGFLT